MTTEVSATVGFALAGTAALIATPVAIAVARRTDFYDRPRDYRQHAAPTPFLGGAAVLLAFLIAALVVGGATETRWGVLLLCALAMWAIGTIDDRVAVAPQWRVLVGMAAGMALYMVGLGWKLPLGDAADLVLTVFWVVGLVNAFNLMDNLDGACGTVASVSAIGIGTLAAIHAEPLLAGMGFALAAACVAFLRFNLARPSRIFLGDGGSMPVGFLVAALGMATSRPLRDGDPALFAIALMAGVVILDTTLVTVSRKRRGVPLVTGGRDHLTHRLLTRLRSPRRVAAVLATAQAVLCTLAIVGDQLGFAALVGLAMAAVVLAPLVIAVLDSEPWRPAGIAVAPLPQPSEPAVPALEPAQIE